MVGFERLPTVIPRDVELTGLSLRETPATACFPRWVRGISHATWSVPDRLTGVTIAQDFNQSSGKEFQLFFNQMTAAETGPAGVSDQYTVLTGETRRHCRAASGSEVTVTGQKGHSAVTSPNCLSIQIADPKQYVWAILL